MISVGLDQLGAPAQGTARELLGWRPVHGLFSLYVDVDPGDRRQSWRIALRNGLDQALKATEKDADRETRLAVRATVERIEQELPDELSRAEVRGFFGFVEAARGDEGESRWYATQLPPRRTEALWGPIAELHPLLALLDDGAPIGAAAVSADRVRLLDWRLGQARELHGWELEYFGDDWRERKANRPKDPARGEAISASGRDQHDQRMEANRERFARETGGLAGGEAGEQGWRELLVFGDERYARRFEDGLNGRCSVRHVDHADLISEPTHEIERRLEAILPSVNRERERALIARIKDAAYAEGRSSLGVQETVQALWEGRVEHLVFDAERDYADVALNLEFGDEAADMPLLERMIDLALSKSAAITPVEGESAEALADQEGVAALLRY